MVVALRGMDTVIGFSEKVASNLAMRGMGRMLNGSC